MGRKKYLIVNGDDFGASRGINRGILEAHTTGILTSTSLMVNMPASHEAVSLAALHPNLSVGLHVNFTNEGEDPVVDVADANACARELTHQYQMFRNLMDTRPTHIDSHHNVHLQPHLSALFVALADREHIPLRGHSPARYFGNYFGQWDGEAHLEHIGVHNLEHMMLTETRTDVTELACHPGYVDPAFQTTYDIEREAELKALCVASLPHILDKNGITLISFADLPRLAAPTSEDHETMN